MSETDKRWWWKDLFRRDVVAGHVVNALIAIAVSSAVGFAVTIVWISWAAWRGSYIWTQRLIGASMAFAIFTATMAIAVMIIRHRLKIPRPVVAKGYLDHQVDSAKAQAAMIRIHGKITDITKKETKQVTANTARLERILKLPYERQLAKNLALSRRSARLTDKTTKELAAQIPRLATAAEAYSNAELAYWTWRTANVPLSVEDALAIQASIEQQLRVTNDLLQSQVEGKVVTEDRRGVSQAVNEAVERRLDIIDRQCAITSAQKERLQKVLALLEPFTKVKKA